LTPKCVGIKKAVFEISHITRDEELRLIDVCNKIRELSVYDVSVAGLLKAHDILTGGASLPSAIKSINEKSLFILDELGIITRNPPPTRTYMTKLEKAYTALKTQ
jgi:hypothetical protein